MDMDMDVDMERRCKHEDPCAHSHVTVGRALVLLFPPAGESRMRPPLSPR